MIFGMSSLEKIEIELKGLGYTPFFIDAPQGRAVVISYCIPIGKYIGKKVWLGFSFQEEGYPEYPPHWIHISPPYDDQLGGSQPYTLVDEKIEESAREWLALSRPPKKLWDNLATKTMEQYLRLHVPSFCNKLK